MLPRVTRHASPAKRNQGFTLLEVLGAVAVLGIWYFVLAALATDGLLKQGQNLRKLQAGIIADRVLAELEVSSLGGSVPERMDETFEGELPEDEIFTIRKQVHEFTLDYRPANAPREELVLYGATPNERLPLPNLLGQNIPGFAQHLYTMKVQVSWTEGFMAEESVHRTSYVFDMLSAAEVYESAEIEEADEADEEEQAEAEEPSSGRNSKNLEEQAE